MQLNTDIPPHFQLENWHTKYEKGKKELLVFLCIIVFDTGIKKMPERREKKIKKIL